MTMLVVLFITGTISPITVVFDKGSHKLQMAHCRMSKKSLDKELKKGLFIYESKCVQLY